jgi:hypothetical protein
MSQHLGRRAFGVLLVTGGVVAVVLPVVIPVLATPGPRRRSGRELRSCRSPEPSKAGRRR